jgi:hypothetical protein
MDTEPSDDRDVDSDDSNVGTRFEVIIDPANPFDFDQDEIDQLIEELREAQPNAEIVAHFRDETEYGGALMEVLHIWVIGREFVNTNWETMVIVTGAVNWLRKRWLLDKETSPERPRPRSALVYDQEERRIFSILIDLPNGEPITESVESAPHSHRRPEGARSKQPEIHDQDADSQ